MFHSDTEALIKLWTSLRSGPESRAGLPSRASLHPEALGPRLTRVFLADRNQDEADARLRLAGDWLEAFHHRPLTGVALSSLWRARSHTMIAAAMRQAVREARPVVIVAAAGAANGPIEVTLVPFQGEGQRRELILGLYAPTATLTLPTGVAHQLAARVFTAVGEAGRPRLALASLDGRRIA